MAGPVLITGVSGFIGWHLASHFLKQGISVIGVDKHKDADICRLEETGRFSFQLADLTVKEQATVAFKESVSIVYHLAGQPFVWFANANPREDCLANVVGTINVLEGMRFLGCRRIVFASTGDVYQDTYLADETHPTDPQNFYGLSKLVAENYIRLYSRLFSMGYTILRLGLVYGPGLRRNVIYDISEAVIAGKEAALSLSAESEYDCIYIDDVVDAMYQASSDVWLNKTVNISTGKGTKVSDILELVTRYCPGRATPTISFSRDGNIVRKVYINRLALTLGWQPRHTLEEGLKRVIEHRLAKGTSRGS